MGGLEDKMEVLRRGRKELRNWVKVSGDEGR
jgi:hypothetical protein